MNFGVVTFAVDFWQLPKIMFWLDFCHEQNWTFDNYQNPRFLEQTFIWWRNSAIVESSVLFTTKIQPKHNFWQLPKVDCESHYTEIHATLNDYKIVLLDLE
jgi:hypothetical protein